MVEIIIKSNENIIKLLDEIKLSSSKYRFNKYLVKYKLKNEEAYLLFNLITGSFIKINITEYDDALTDVDLGIKDETSKYLVDNYYIVKDDLQENTLHDLYINTYKSDKKIEKAIILTTNKCNANCKYCYETKQKNRINMSEENALQVVEYLKNNIRDRVILNWIGGEPLYNSKAIDIICKGLLKNNIEFKSTIITNGYLLNKETIRIAKKYWKVYNVQISLDGTEDNYNKTKNFIYKDNAFARVIENIQLLNDNDIKVSIRLNYNKDNIDDIIKLSDYLMDKIDKAKNVNIYGSKIYYCDKKYTDEELKKFYDKIAILEEKIYLYDVRNSNMPIMNNYHCMANNDNDIVILSDGRIGKCEHFINTNTIGNIWDENKDENMINSFKERVDLSKKKLCKDCILNQCCYILKKCTGDVLCYNEYNKKYKINKIIYNMKRRYMLYLFFNKGVDRIYLDKDI